MIETKSLTFRKVLLFLSNFVLSDKERLKKIILNIVVVLIWTNTNAQDWRFLRNEVSFGIGASNFLGELGGRDRIGTNKSPVDLEFSMTRPTFSANYRYKINPWFMVRGGLTYGWLSGTDALTEEQYRRNRNLHFRSPIVEWMALAEFYPWGENSGHLYRSSGVRGRKVRYWSPYGFMGVGGFWFNPKAQYTDGKWYALQPLGTEGQGLPGANAPYRRVSLAIPIGIGVKYALNRQWSIGFEIGHRVTFTDYIDDVSGVYYDNAAIRSAKGDMAAHFADPNIGIVETFVDGNYVYNPTGPGMQRGNNQENDAYMFAIFSVHYKFLKGRYNFSKF